MLSISLPRTFEDQGSGYPLRVAKVTLKWTGPVKMLTIGHLGSSLLNMHYDNMKNLQLEMQATIGILGHLKGFLRMALEVMPALEDYGRGMLVLIVMTLHDIGKKKSVVKELFKETRRT